MKRFFQNKPFLYGGITLLLLLCGGGAVYVSRSFFEAPRPKNRVAGRKAGQPLAKAVKDLLWVESQNNEELPMEKPPAERKPLKGWNKPITKPLMEGAELLQSPLGSTLSSSFSLPEPLPIFEDQSLPYPFFGNDTALLETSLPFQPAAMADSPPFKTPYAATDWPLWASKASRFLDSFASEGQIRPFHLSEFPALKIERWATDGLLAEGTSRLPLDTDVSYAGRFLETRSDDLSIRLESELERYSPRNASKRSLVAYGLPLLPSSQDLSEFLRVDVELAGKNTAGESFFKLKFTPRKNLALATIPQTFYFVVDRTKGVELRQQEVYLQAIDTSLEQLPERSRFNVILIGKKTSWLYPEAREASAEHVSEAKKFLHTCKSSNRKQEIVEDLLAEISALNVKEQGLVQVFVLSAGYSDDPVQLQSSLDELQKLLRHNTQSTLIIHGACVLPKSQPEALKKLAFTTGGSFVGSDTYTAFPRLMARQVYQLRNSYIYSFACEAKGLEGSLLVKQPLLSNEKSLELLGPTTSLKDLTVYVHGFSDRGPVIIKKTITFQRAAPPHALLSKEWKELHDRLGISSRAL